MKTALIVVPAYNESLRLPRLLGEIKAYFESGLQDAEGLQVRFVVVDDGSRADEAVREAELVRQLQLGDAVAFLRLESNRGKGGAVRAGFDLAVRDGLAFTGFIDCDSSVSILEMHRALVCLKRENDANDVAGLIGSRVRMLGRHVERSALRHYTGRIFATFVGLYFQCGAYDTQCGLKLFRTDALVRYLHVPSDQRWIWDTQLLLAMLHGGETIHELPVDWQERDGSKISVGRDSLRMVWGLVKFRRRLRGVVDARSGRHPPDGSARD